MLQYALTCTNKSSLYGSFAVFQTFPSEGLPTNAFPLVWFAQPSAPRTSITFSWVIQYQFAWAVTGPLKPGGRFVTKQIANADLVSRNRILLTKDKSGNVTFDEQSKGSEGHMTIRPAADLKANQISAAIGMSGNPVYAVQAIPGADAHFLPRSKYWVAFGNYETGTVLDPNGIAGAKNFHFPLNTNEIDISFGFDNRLAITG